MKHNQSFTVGKWKCDGGKDALLGKGSFADVFKGYNTETGQEVAIKVIDVVRITKGNQKLAEHLTSEVQIMKGLSHENIVKLYDIVQVSDSHLYMIFEYCAGGDFHKYIVSHKRLTEERALYFMKQLAYGLKFLRLKNIIHRDLKPQNLLLSTTGDDAVLKIADFGFAKMIQPQSVVDTLCGSPLYMAPEILKLQKYTVKADLWSVGCILYETLTGTSPFPVKTQIELMNVIDKKKSIEFPTNIPNVSKECINLVESLLQVDPMRRISWEEFFLHPWLNLNSVLTELSRSYTMSSPISIAPSDQAGSRKSFSGPESYGRPRSITSPSPEFQLPLTSPRGRATTGPSPLIKTASIPEGIGTPSSLQSRHVRTYSFGKSSGGVDTRFSPPPHNLIKSDEQGGSSIGVPKIDLTKSPPLYQSLAAQELERRGQRALAIAAIGDMRFENEQIAEAAALYIKALSCLHSLLLEVTRTIQLMSLQSASELNTVYSRYKECFSDYLRKAEALRKMLRPNDSVITAEKLIYDFALQLGRDAAVQELLHNFPKADKKYENGLLLLEQLFAEVTAPKDKEILQNYIAGFINRITQLRIKQQTAVQ